MEEQGTVIIYSSGRNKRTGPGGRIGNIRLGNSSPAKHSIFYYFYKIAEYLGETTWMGFFDIMSKGSFFKEFKYDGRILTCKQKNKSHTIELYTVGNMDLRTDLEQDMPMYQQCKEFISKYSSYFSNTESESDFVGYNKQTQLELSSSNQHLDHMGNVILTNDFGKRTGIAKQKPYIKNFTRRICEENDLTDRHAECLFSSIFVHLSLKIITHKSFNMNPDGTIHSIDGLEVDQNGYRFVHSNSPVHKSRKREEDISTECEEVQKVKALRCSRNLTIFFKKYPIGA